MKKSSRDYRKRNRKKWIEANRRNMNAILSAVFGAVTFNTILSTPGMSKEEKCIRIFEQTLHTVKSIQSAYA